MPMVKNSLSFSNLPAYEEMKSYESHNNRVFFPFGSNIFKLLKTYHNISYYALFLPEKIEVDRDRNLTVKCSLSKGI